MKYPKSPYEKEGGLYHFPRMLDKIRMHEKGELNASYDPRLGKGFDYFLCKFLGVEYQDVIEQGKAGQTDTDILEWCYETGRRRDEYDCMLFNKFLQKLGWRDEDNGITGRLKNYKRDLNLERDDIETIFDLIEVDEKRKD